jgi:uncharacterized protein YuzE
MKISLTRCARILNLSHGVYSDIAALTVVLLRMVKQYIMLSLIGALRHENQVFQETDTLYIEFRTAEISETRDLDENTQLDVDRDRNICAMPIEHARERADIPHFSFEQIAA